MTQSVIQIVSSSLAPGSLLRIIIFNNMICMYLFKNIHIHVECIKPSTKAIHGEARYHHISILRPIIISFHTRLQQKWNCMTLYWNFILHGYRCFSPYFHLLWLLADRLCQRRWGPGNLPTVLRGSLHWSDLCLCVTGHGCGGFWKKLEKMGCINITICWETTILIEIYTI